MSQYKPCPHLDCRYYRDNVTRHLGNCMYMDITGHSRIKGLTLEQAMDKKHCPRYEPKDGAKPARRPPIPVDHTNARIRELYDKGWHDRKIAETLGITRSRVGNWRKRNKLPVNKEPPATKYDWELGLHLYRRGMSDVQISKQLGCSVNTVTNWRNRRELPANYPAPRIDWNLARQLYDEGLNDCQIAAKLQCHEASVMEWRKKNGLIAQKYRRAGDGN